MANSSFFVVNFSHMSLSRIHLEYLTGIGAEVCPFYPTRILPASEL